MKEIKAIIRAYDQAVVKKKASGTRNGRSTGGFLLS